MRITRVLFALVVLVLFSVVRAQAVPAHHDDVSATSAPVDVWEQKSTQQVCEELRDALNNKQNVTDFFTPRWRFAYLTRELPFGDDYTGMCGIRRFMHLVHSHIENPKCVYEVHAVDEGMELCVLKSVSSGKWRRSGREFHDIDHYWEFKAFSNKIVGGRLFDGEKAKEWIESYRTPAQQVAYGLASAIFGHGYKSKEAKDHLSADAKLMLHPSGFTRYGPQVFKGNDAVAQAVDFVERAMKDRGGWRYGPHEPHHLHDRDRDDGRDDRDDDDDDKKKPDGRGPFPLPLPYMGHWCDIQFTNATVAAGICVFPPMGHCAHRRHRHHRRHHASHMMSAFSNDADYDEDEDDFDFDNDDAFGVTSAFGASSAMGSDNDFAHHRPSRRFQMIREMYVRGFMTYFNMRLGEDGKINRIFIMPLQPMQPGYHGFRTHAVRAPSDTRNGNIVIDRNHRYNVMDRGATDDNEVTDDAGTTTTTATTIAPTSAPVPTMDTQPVDAVTRAMLRAISSWLGLPEGHDNDPDARLVVTLIAEGDRALLAAEHARAWAAPDKPDVRTTSDDKAEENDKADKDANEEDEDEDDDYDDDDDDYEDEEEDEEEVW